MSHDRELFVLPPFTALWVAREELAGTRDRMGGAGCTREHLGRPYRRHLGADVDRPRLPVRGGRAPRAAPRSRRTRWRHRPEGRHRNPLRTRSDPVRRREPSDADDQGPFRRAAPPRRDPRGRPSEDLARVVVAYEPSWAIGAGASAASVDHVSAVQLSVHDWLSERGCTAPRVIYGGSVDRDTCDDLLALTRSGRPFRRACGSRSCGIRAHRARRRSTNVSDGRWASALGNVGPRMSPR